jgi:hypothetical protein
VLITFLMAAAVATLVTRALFGDCPNDTKPSLYDQFMWARILFWLLAVVLLSLFVAVLRTAGEV